MRKEHEGASENGRKPTNGEASSKRRKKPRYEAKLRELRVGEVVVKSFTQKSDGQEIILLAFQEQGWSTIIDDPLMVKDDQDAKECLRRAVDNLNRRQRVPLLHFRVIHQGTGVAWEFRAERR
jgi:hypothetical protein